MSTGARVFFLLLIVAFLAYLAYTGQPLALPDLGGSKAEPKKPDPDTPKKPLLPILPRREATEDVVGAITVGGPTGPGGVEVQCDLPLSLRTKNVGGSDGAGLCVFTSIGHAARWQGEPVLRDFQQFMRSRPGGSWPEKTDKMIEAISREKGREVKYLQYEGKDPAILEAALKTGRMPGVTYDGRDPHYRGRIAHMVNLVYLDAATAAILDNNFVGENELVWMSRAEFLSRWTGGGGNGWAVVILDDAPAPVPTN